MNPKSAAALALAALTLAACNNTARPMAANSKICTSFKTDKAAAPAAPTAGLPAATAADAAAPVDDCLRRWAYSLAPSTDPADAVADATVAACSGALSRWNQTGLAAGPAGDANGPVEAMSLTTGQPTNALAEHYAFAQSRALLYVVQARAGRCAPPVAKDGVPAGATG